jgi:hypothetical protein
LSKIAPGIMGCTCKAKPVRQRLQGKFIVNDWIIQWLAAFVANSNFFQSVAEKGFS